MTETENKYKLERFECPYCLNLFSKGYNKKHEKICPQNPKNQVNGYLENKEQQEEYSFYCSKCNMGFEREEQKRLHESWCNPKKNQKKEQIKEPILNYDIVNETYGKCQFCNKVLAKVDMEKHESLCNQEEEKELIDAFEELYDPFVRLRTLKKDFIEIYDILTPEQVKNYLDQK